MWYKGHKTSSKFKVIFLAVCVARRVPHLIFTPSMSVFTEECMNSVFHFPQSVRTSSLCGIEYNAQKGCSICVLIWIAPGTSKEFHRNLFTGLLSLTVHTLGFDFPCGFSWVWFWKADDLRVVRCHQIGGAGHPAASETGGGGSCLEVSSVSACLRALSFNLGCEVHPYFCGA